MNQTFQLIRRARADGCALRPAQPVTASAGPAHVRSVAPDQIALDKLLDEPVHTGSIYRGLMQKHDRMTTRHLK
jgi:hypothetical protein